MKTVYVQTFGCQMNVADSAEMLLHLSARGCASADTLEGADIALINTCTIRDHAEHKALSYLGRLAKWKAAKAGRIIIFAGCAAQRLGRGVRRKFPQADIIAGAKSIDGFADILDKSNLFAPALSPVEGGALGGPVALVNITRGCSCKCSYCIVPYVRGEASSIQPGAVLAAARRKIAAGAKEIVLLGQTVNGYSYEGVNFAKLITQVAALDGLERLRFLSPHPIFINQEFVKAAASSPKIARHMHLPVQSGSTKILKDMRRGYSREEFLQKAKMLARAGWVLSTDIIVGYPGETDEDFAGTLSLFDEINFTGAYCFKFSPRAGTPAALLPGVDDKIVDNRLDILLNRVRQSSARAYAGLLCTKQTVLFETPTNGRTEGNFWVRTRKKYAPGQLAEVEIKQVKDTILLA